MSLPDSGRSSQTSSPHIADKKHNAAYQLALMFALDRQGARPDIDRAVSQVQAEFPDMDARVTHALLLLVKVRRRHLIRYMVAHPLGRGLAYVIWFSEDTQWLIDAGQVALGEE